AMPTIRKGLRLSLRRRDKLRPTSKPRRKASRGRWRECSTARRTNLWMHPWAKRSSAIVTSRKETVCRNSFGGFGASLHHGEEGDRQRRYASCSNRAQRLSTVL